MSESSANNKNLSAAAKRRQADPPGPDPTGLRKLLSLASGPTVLSILWPAILLIVGYTTWHRWGNHYIGQKFYGVNASLISVSPPPSYVRSDVVEDVYEAAALDEMSVMDSQACANIASAFASHPWVQRVVGVRKLAGGRIDIRLEYREPIAMVHVVNKPALSGRLEFGQSQSTPLETGFFAIDGRGVLLPPSDFAPADTESFLHIIVPGAYPTGGIGTKFGDARVEGAALLAYLLHPHRAQLGITSIGVHGDMRDNPVVQLELAGVRDVDNRPAQVVKWFWGSPPGMEAQGEQPALMKMQALLAGAPAQSDLRQLQYSAVATQRRDNTR